MFDAAVFVLPPAIAAEMFDVLPLTDMEVPSIAIDPAAPALACVDVDVDKIDEFVKLVGPVAGKIPVPVITPVVTVIGPAFPDPLVEVDNVASTREADEPP